MHVAKRDRDCEGGQKTNTTSFIVVELGVGFLMRVIAGFAGVVRPARGVRDRTCAGAADRRSELSAGRRDRAVGDGARQTMRASRCCCCCMAGRAMCSRPSCRSTRRMKKTSCWCSGTSVRRAHFHKERRGGRDAGEADRRRHRPGAAAAQALSETEAGGDGPFLGQHRRDGHGAAEAGAVRRLCRAPDRWRRGPTRCSSSSIS